MSDTQQTDAQQIRDLTERWAAAVHDGDLPAVQAVQADRADRADHADHVDHAAQ